MPRIVSREEIKEFGALVRAGRLFDVVAWLDAGKPFRSSDTRLAPREPCVVAVETGFFSMVEAFLRQELLEDDWEKCWGSQSDCTDRIWSSCF
jgi:hypothetical protein